MQDIKENYKLKLIESIPIVKNFHVDIKEVFENKVVISTPLNLHINYEGTAFGGSLNTSCVLASYLLIHHLMNVHEVPFTSLVIQNSNINYLKPVHSDFLATATVSEEEKNRFLTMLKKRGVGRICVNALVNTGDDERDLCEFSARFVATIGDKVSE